MSATPYPEPGRRRPTGSFPLHQRAAMSIFRPIGRWTAGFFGQVGSRVYFVFDIFRALAEVRTYAPLTITCSPRSCWRAAWARG